MATLQEIEELDFQDMGVPNLELRAYQTGIVGGNNKVTKIILEEPPTRRLVTTVNGQIPIWLPWIYHILDVKNYRIDNGWGATHDNYRIGARATQLTARGGNIQRFSYFNLDITSGSVCYYPTYANNPKAGVPLAQRLVYYINEWWMGITNYHWIPDGNKSALALHIYEMLYQTGFDTMANWGGTIADRKGWYVKKDPSGPDQHYLMGLYNNTEVEKVLECWTQLSMLEVLELQSEEPPELDIETLMRRDDNTFILSKSGSENSKLFKEVKLTAAEELVASITI